jgi:hypothetical protein
VILILLDIKIEKQSETTITEAQLTTDDLTTKMNEILKFNVEQGMFKYSHY